MKERKTQCILGNGGCPNQCRLHDSSEQINAALGPHFDGNESRTQLLFADTTTPGISVIDIERLLASCLNEPKRNTLAIDED